jgi:hypothetical protein
MSDEFCLGRVVRNLPRGGKTRQNFLLIILLINFLMTLLTYSKTVQSAAQDRIRTFLDWLDPIRIRTNRSGSRSKTRSDLKKLYN